MVSYLKDLIEEERFCITVEASPPRGADVESFVKELRMYKKLKVDLVSISDKPYGKLRMSSLGGCVIARKNHVEPILQLSCRDENLLGIQSELLSAAALGIETVLAMDGHHPSLGDFPEATPVYDLDSTRLIRLVRSLNRGHDWKGDGVSGYIDFFPGTTIATSMNPRTPELLKIKRKLMAGCGFFQTKPVFDPKELDSFFQEYEMMFGENIRRMVLIGILPIHSASLLHALKNLPDATIPEELDEVLGGRDDLEDISVRFSIALITEVRNLGFGGVHIMPGGRPDIVARIIAGIRKSASNPPAELSER